MAEYFKKICIYNWITLLYTWNGCSIVKQLYSNKFFKKSKKETYLKSLLPTAEVTEQKYIFLHLFCRNFSYSSWAAECIGSLIVEWVVVQEQLVEEV